MNPGNAVNDSRESPVSSGHVRFGGAGVGRAHPTTTSNRTRSGHSQSPSLQTLGNTRVSAKRTCPPDNRTTCPVRAYGDPSRSPVRTGRTVLSYRVSACPLQGVDPCVLHGLDLCLFSFSVLTGGANPSILLAFPVEFRRDRRAACIGREIWVQDDPTAARTAGRARATAPGPTAPPAGGGPRRSARGWPGPRGSPPLGGST